MPEPPSPAAFVVPPPRARSLGFARTKIQPPRPRQGTLLARPPLDTRLAEALAGQRLVLVSAAAGYGKTSVLARQIAQLPPGTALAWVAADAGDDLHRLLECLVAALEPFDPPWRVAPEALLGHAADPRTRARAAADLLNTLDACDAAHGVIVFDDLHRVDDPAFFEFLDRLLERLSTRWTVAIGTRHDPPLALARLRAIGELAEFRQADLAFDRNDVLQLAALTGGDPAEADALLARTCGWPAGLRLGLQPQFRGRAADRAMFDFLAAEVIAQTDAELRSFLLHTSVLPELTAQRAAAVSGNPRAALLMEQVDRLGLFVTTLDAREPTLKLHDLFREALQQQLQREHPADWPALWQRAAAGESDPVRKLTMLLHAGDLPDAAQTLLQQTPPLLTQGALATVAHLVEQFPAPFTATSPAMQTVRGLLCWARWDFAAMLDAMRCAELGFVERRDSDRARAAVAYQSLALNALGRHAEGATRLTLLRREEMSLDTRVVVLVACIWHALELGADSRVGPLLDELVDLLETTDDASLWYRGHPPPRLNGVPGTAAALQRYVAGALRVAGDRPLPLRAMAHAQAGWHAAWHNGDLRSAEAALATALDDSRWLGDPPNVCNTLLQLATFLHTLRGDRPRALASAQALVESQPPGRGNWSLSASVHTAARVAALFADQPLLQQHLAGLEQAALSAPALAPQLEPLRGHRARLAGDGALALRHWQAAVADDSALARLGQAAETRMVLAAGLHEAGRSADAAAVLAPVFAQVNAGAGIGGVLLARDALSSLAQAAAAGPLARALDGAQCAALQRWWMLAQGGNGATSLAAPQPPDSGIGGLSARELEVLQRMAAGDSNKLIARAFDLSPHTVKRHVANILDKLGAASRGQAAAWYLKQR